MLRSRLVLLFALLGFLLCGLLTPTTAHAANPAKLFARGQKLYDKKKPEEALPLFREALEATGSPNARLYVARCLRDTGELVEAYDEMQTTLKDATTKAVSEKKYVPTRDSAKAELALLEPRIAKLIVAPTAEYDNLSVRVGDRELSAAELGVPLTVLPGTVEVSSSADDMLSQTRELKLAAGTTKTLALTLQSVNAQNSVSLPPDGKGGSGGEVRLAGIVIAGVGAAALIGFAVTGVLANQRFAQLSDECGGVRCTDPTYADVVDEGKLLSTIANVSAVAGGVLALSGTVMIIFGGPSEPDTSEPAVDAAIMPLPGGAALSVSGRF